METNDAWVALTAPRRRTSILVACVAVCALAVFTWLAVQPGAPSAQTKIVQWLNDPPQPFAAILSIANPLLRPIPLSLIAVALLAWVLVAARFRSSRLEVLRALVIAFVIAEILAQGLKLVVDKPRPIAVIDNLDRHGYPGTPLGSGFPSAHAAVVVGLVCALWPWMRWAQRLVAALLVVVICFDRIYIGAHWPLDVLGGIAIGFIAGAVVWLVASRWPIHPRTDGAAQVST